LAQAIAPHLEGTDLEEAVLELDRLAAEAMRMRDLKVAKDSDIGGLQEKIDQCRESSRDAREIIARLTVLTRRVNTLLRIDIRGDAAATAARVAAVGAAAAATARRRARAWSPVGLAEVMAAAAWVAPADEAAAGDVAATPARLPSFWRMRPWRPRRGSSSPSSKAGPAAKPAQVASPAPADREGRAEPMLSRSAEEERTARTEESA
jgi:hypothetical protein